MLRSKYNARKKNKESMLTSMVGSEEESVAVGVAAKSVSSMTSSGRRLRRHRVTRRHALAARMRMRTIAMGMRLREKRKKKWCESVNDMV